MKFKVGDKVRVLVEESLFFGKDCVVVCVRTGAMYPYEVECNVRYSFYKEEDLQLIEEPKEDFNIQFEKSLVEDMIKKYGIVSPSIEPLIKIKDERLNKLKQLIKAVNTLGEFGKEVELKVTIELDGKKIEL